MRVFGTQDCAGLNQAEAEAVSALSYLYSGLCQRLGGLTLWVWRTSDGTFVDAWGRRVAGLAWCDLASIELGSDDWVHGAYAHEVAHIAQCPFQDGSHATWAELGVWEALEGLRAEGLEKGLPDDLGDTDAP